MPAIRGSMQFLAYFILLPSRLSQILLHSYPRKPLFDDKLRLVYLKFSKLLRDLPRIQDVSIHCLILTRSDP